MAFGPGDLALCVDDSACRCGLCGGAPVTVKAGRVYRVEYVWLHVGQEALLIEGMPHNPGHADGILARRFRKITAPETEISRQIKACKPVLHPSLNPSRHSVELA